MNTRALVIASLLLLPIQAAAQTRRPWVTEDLATLGSGKAEVQLGFAFDDAFVSPALPLEGRLLSVPTIALAAGLGGRAEFQLLFPAWNRLSPDAGESMSSVGDVVIATKIRIVGGVDGKPGLGFRYRVKLPNAAETKGVGSDTTDFYADVLAAASLGSLRVHGSLGLQILGDPLKAASQNDLFGYGVVAEWPVGKGAVGVEVEGVIGPDVTDTTTLRGGGRIDLGRVTVDGALSHKWRGDLKGVGATAGVTIPVSLGGG